MNNEQSPFSNPNDVNPFADPSVASHTQQQYKGGLDDYNPFDGQKTTQTSVPVIPATIEPTNTEPTPTSYQPKPFVSEEYTPTSQSALKRQEDLEKKVAELEAKDLEIKRQQQLNQRDYTNNFPPLPKFCPVQPCFFHDISLEIPIGQQKTCKLMYYIWQLYLFTLFYNFVASLAFICDDGKNAPYTFGISIVNMVLFPCLTYFCWYSRIYNALKKDSSFNYMVFFFVTFFKICFMIIYSLGVWNFGTCGWINATEHINDKEKHKAVAILMYVAAILWTILALLIFLMMRRIHNAYRHSGASWEKAQGEFAQNIASNKSVQNAAAQGVKAGVSGALSSGTQY